MFELIGVAEIPQDAFVEGSRIPSEYRTGAGQDHLDATVGITHGNDVGEVLEQRGVVARCFVQVAEHWRLRRVEWLDECDHDGGVLLVGALERDAHPLHLTVDHAGSTTRDDDAFGRWHEKLALIAGVNEIERETRLIVVDAIPRNRREQIVGPAEVQVGVEFGYTDRRARHDGGSLIGFEIREWFRCGSNHRCSVSAGRR